MNIIIQKYIIELDKINTVTYPDLDVLSIQKGDHDNTFIMYAIHDESDVSTMNLTVYKSGDSIDWTGQYITSIGDLHFFKIYM